MPEAGDPCSRGNLLIRVLPPGWEQANGKGKDLPTYGHLPICMQISPMAQVALLQTEMNSGFRLVPRMGMNSASGEKEGC